MSSKKRSSAFDRAEEYIDSPVMTKRLSYGRELSARIQGNYGVYRTRVRVGDTAQGTCTCPSEEHPCKHIRALEATWNKYPETFFELEHVVEDLTSQSRPQLIDLVAQMALIAPETLAACGVEEFEEDGDEEMYD